MRSAKNLVKFFVAFLMTPAAYGDGSPSCPAIKKCDTAISRAKAEDIVSGLTTSTGGGMKQDSQALKNRAGAQTGATCTAFDTCLKEKDTIKVDDINGPCRTSDKKAIEKKVAALEPICVQAASATADSQVTEQAVSNDAVEGPVSSGSGLGSGLATAGVAALAAGAVALLMKKNHDKDNDSDKDSADLGNGQFDCSKADAYEFEACTRPGGQLERMCASALDSELCQKFSKMYCADSGDGFGSPYCKGVLAWNFCHKPRPPGRDLCPSCLKVDSNQSEICAANPASCMPQNSPAEIAKAKQTCPTDPLFSDPIYTAGGGAQVPSQLTGGGLPAVILPQSVSGGRDVATASFKPASDVDSVYGPSVFSTASQALIRKRCQTDKSNNCR